jgi:hypothetical protein
VAAEKERAAISSALETSSESVVASILKHCDREQAAVVLEAINQSHLSVSTACMVIAQLLANVLGGVPDEERPWFSSGVLRLALSINQEARAAATLAAAVPAGAA